MSTREKANTDFGLIATNTIDLEIVSASNLKKAERFSESDPYVKVGIDGRYEN